MCKSNYTINEKFTSNKSSKYCDPKTNDTAVSTTTTTTTQTSTTKITPSLEPTQVAPTSTLKSVTSSSSTTTMAPTQSTKTTTTTTTSATIPSNETATTKNKTESNTAQPQAHHFLGGILVPILFVLAFIGAAFAVKKYDLIERAQTIIRNRRAAGQPHQTRYDGLENDFDDDPLLI